VRTGDAERLVQHQNEPRRRINPLTLDGHPIRKISRDLDLLIRTRHGHAIQNDLSGRDQTLNLPPLAIAEIGEEAVKTHHGAHARAS